jgi:hypothetical protein
MISVQRGPNMFQWGEYTALRLQLLVKPAVYVHEELER